MTDKSVLATEGYGIWAEEGLFAAPWSPWFTLYAKSS